MNNIGVSGFKSFHGMRSVRGRPCVDHFSGLDFDAGVFAYLLFRCFSVHCSSVLCGNGLSVSILRRLGHGVFTVFARRDLQDIVASAYHMFEIFQAQNCVLLFGDKTAFFS